MSDLLEKAREFCREHNTNHVGLIHQAMIRGFAVAMESAASGCLANHRREIHQGEVYFFGQYGSAGHYLHYKGKKRTIDEQPWGDHIDGGPLKQYRIPDDPKAREWCCDRKDGWTLIAIWDRSGDSRPGSHSTFIIEADIPSQDLWTLARAQWPEVFKRPGFPIP